MAKVALRSRENEAGRLLEPAGKVLLRSALAGTLLLVGALKFARYEAENIQPMVSTSPLFSWMNRRMGTRKIARLIGITEIALGTLISARPLSPGASALGSLGATAMFLTTLSFLFSMPGSCRRTTSFRRSPWRGSFWPKTAYFWGRRY